MLILFCTPVLARWTEPVPLNEVNSEYEGQSWVFLSFDGLTLYFARWGIEGRNLESGMHGVDYQNFHVGRGQS